VHVSAPLHATLTVDYPLPMVLTTPATDEAATASVMDSADFDVPAAALVFNGLHDRGDQVRVGGPNPKTINGKQVSAIYIADPDRRPQPQVAMADWFDDCVSPERVRPLPEQLAMIAGRPARWSCPGIERRRRTGDRPARWKPKAGRIAPAPKPRPPRRRCREEGEKKVSKRDEPCLPDRDCGPRVGEARCRPPRTGRPLAGASAEAPLLVKRLDKTDNMTHLVAFSVGDRVTARLRMHAYSGDYSEGIGIGKEGDKLPPYTTPAVAYRRMVTVLTAAAKKKKQKGPLPTIAIEPFYGWKPCAQSFSSFLPFYVIHVGPDTRYVRVDGKVYEALTLGAGL
jgi:hypothetical protein